MTTTTRDARKASENTTKTFSQEEVQALLEKTRQEVRAKTLAESKVPKEYSEYFLKNDGTDFKWSNLSETKRHFEETHPEYLNQLVEEMGHKLRSVDFHNALDKLLK